MPELPDARRQRFVAAYALPEYDAAQLTQSRETADFFEAAVHAGASPKAASNWMMGELARVLKESRRDDRRVARSVAGASGRACSTLIDKGTISGAMAKDVFEKMVSARTDAPTRSSRARASTQIDDEPSRF